MAGYRVQATTNDRGSSEHTPVVTAYVTDLAAGVIVRDALANHLPGLLAISQGKFEVHRSLNVRLQPVLPGDTLPTPEERHGRVG